MIISINIMIINKKLNKKMRIPTIKTLVCINKWEIINHEKILILNYNKILKKIIRIIVHVTLLFEKIINIFLLNLKN